MTIPSGVNYSDKQKAFMTSGCKRAAFIGGRQSGKTEALAGIAVGYATDGKEVVFGAPSQRMWKEAMKQIRNHIGSQSVANTLDTLKMPSGGRIKMTSFSQRMHGTHLNPDVLLIDEFTDLRDEKLTNVEIDDCTRVYAAGTPRNFDMPLIEKGWDITLAQTLSNPKVDQSSVQQWQNYQENARRKLMKPIEAGEHGLFPVETGAGTIYKCMFCDFEEELPQNAPGACDKYAIGKAMQCSCL